MDLARALGHGELEPRFLERLESAVSNDPAEGTGADIYRRHVAGSRMEPSETVAHWALKQLVDSHDNLDDYFHHSVRPRRQRPLSGPGLSLVLGEAEVVDHRTGQNRRRVFLAQSQGGTGLRCQVAKGADMNFDAFHREIKPALDEASSDRTADAFQAFFPKAIHFQPADLLPEVRHAIVRTLAGDALSEFRDRSREIFDKHEDVLALFVTAGEELPELAGMLLRLELGDRLLRFIDNGRDKGFNWNGARELADLAGKWNVDLNGAAVKKAAEELLYQRFLRLVGAPDPVHARRIAGFFDLFAAMNLNLDLWACQNLFFELYQRSERSFTREQLLALEEVGRKLGFNV
jgi:hypothetical protein